ncbi:MAG: hypothetical protein JRN39_06000 [Nitrososphaerota archaeon]|nr:hypothetical protein [Nitrososphaerota archaeon]
MGERPARKSFHDLLERLEKEGYTVKLDTSVVGRSGVIHHVDLLAEGKVGKRAIVGLEGRGKNPVEEMMTVFAIAFDAGAEPYYVTEGNVEERIAEFYGIKCVAKGRPPLRGPLRDGTG